jgi:hypothetical protein
MRIGVKRNIRRRRRFHLPTVCGRMVCVFVSSDNTMPISLPANPDDESLLAVAIAASDVLLRVDLGHRATGDQEVRRNQTGTAAHLRDEISGCPRVPSAAVPVCLLSPCAFLKGGRLDAEPISNQRPPICLRKCRRSHGDPLPRHGVDQLQSPGRTVLLPTLLNLPR